MFRRKTGRTKIMYYPMTASLAVNKGTLMAISSGLLILATTTSNGYDIVGVLDRDIKSTDTDYATAYRLVPIEVPIEKNVEWEADVYGTLTVAHVGTYMDITLAVPAATDATRTTNVAQAASSYDICLVSRFISTSKARVILNIGSDARLKANS